MKLRTHLILLVLVAVLPVLLFAGGATVMVERAQSGISELSLQGTAAAISSAVDERISSMIVGLNAFAIAEDFADLGSVHQRAARLVNGDSIWNSIALTLPDGEQLFHTRHPWGAELPSLAGRGLVEAAVATRRPSISGLMSGLVSERPIVAVAIPVTLAREVRYVLVGTLRVEGLSGLLGPELVPQRWTAAVIDPTGRVLARSRAPERYVGSKATAGVRERMASDKSGVFLERTLEGEAVMVALPRSSLTGWRVALGAPVELLKAPFHTALLGLLLGGVALTLLSSGLAVAYGRRMTEPLRSLSASAAAIERGERPVWRGSVVKEVDRVASTLLDTLKRLDEERRTVTTLHEIGSALAVELDLQKLIQRLTDEATALTGAKFGSYFHADVSETGSALRLYTLSGAPYEAFASFGTPRATQLFGPTFRGSGVTRIDDVTRDPRYGKNPPHRGMPEGHLPVRSYLAVSVVSRTGEVLGGLFFGHPDAGVFTERHERQLVAIAAQAAIGIDNARLFLRAKRAIELRDDFLSVASHELKTPLAALQLQVQSVNRKLSAELPAEKLGAWAAAYPRMLRQVGRLSSLIEQLLDVSRLTQGQIALQPEPFELGALVREVAEQFESERERVGSTVVLDLAPADGLWDRSRMEQVIANLLSNALKYGPGEPIRVTLRRDEGRASLSVKDHGIGISPEDQKRVFGRFERAVSARHYGGLGLGLWIVERLVNQHGGVIRLESAPGEGSTFTVELPVQPDARERESAA